MAETSDVSRRERDGLGAVLHGLRGKGADILLATDRRCSKRECVDTMALKMIGLLEES